MTLALGTESYNADAPPVTARGAAYTEVELDRALRGSVSSILWDDSGRSVLESLLASISTTEFSDTAVKRILSIQPVPENWRVGECLAEAFLVEHRECEFPWPTGRDLRNPTASPAGTDLVGFQNAQSETNPHRFAFGEVKTSEHEEWPPSVMNGRHGLKKQLESLRDSDSVKDSLVTYLGHHVNGTDWLPKYRSASARYLANSKDVSLFGIMIRDVEPKREDLSSRALEISLNCPQETSIEFRAMYFPRGTVSSLAQRAIQARGNGNGQN